MLLKALLFLLGPLLSGAEFCFRKVHSPEGTGASSLTTCRGLMSREMVSIADCCSGRGVAYYPSIVTLGRRKKKYRCTPCDEERGDGGFGRLLVETNRTGWSDWSEWTVCSRSCDVGLRLRQRICHGNDTATCVGRDNEEQYCELRQYCPVDGGWGPWEDWSECSRTCDGGIRARSRLCNNPPPEHGGAECSGPDQEQEPCNLIGCPVDGGWSDWSEASVCSVTCGNGRRSRTRTCDQPKPENGGAYCLGTSTISERCQLMKCPRDGDWSLWSGWLPCDVTCGQGTRRRTRDCNAPPPRYGGKDCMGESTEVQVCHSTLPCPVNGGWTDWSDWGLCIAEPCSGREGLAMRVRSCTDPQPRFRGVYCHGPAVDMKKCMNNVSCPVDGQWCSWTDYDECRISDDGPFVRRTRQCACPKPLNGGANCAGDDFQIGACNLQQSVMRESVKCKGRRSDDSDGSGYWITEMMDDEDCD